MAEWRSVCLEDVADDVTVGFVGTMTDQYRSTGIPFLRSLNVEPFQINLSDLKFVDEMFHARLRKSALSPGDVVVVRTGRPGSCAVIPDWLPVANCSDLVVIRPGADLDSKFLMYFINSIASDHIAAHLVGAVQQHFNVASARQMQIDLPPISEQRAIAGILGALDDKIELNRKMNETLEEIARTIFSSWFVNFDPVRAKAEGRQPEGMDAETAALFPDSFVDSELGEIPAGWEASSIGTVSVNRREVVQPGQIGAELAYIGLEHMPRKSISLFDWGNASDVSSGKSRFSMRSLLFGKLRPYFHKVGVAPIEGICSTDILVVEPRQEFWRSFVLFHISSDSLVAYVDSRSTGTKMPRASWGDLSSFPIALPPNRIADKFHSIIDPMLDLIIFRIHESRSLAEVRDTLLLKLLSGEIRVPAAEKILAEVGA